MSIARRGSYSLGEFRHPLAMIALLPHERRSVSATGGYPLPSTTDLCSANSLEQYDNETAAEYARTAPLSRLAYGH